MILAFDANVALPAILVFTIVLLSICIIYMEKYRRKRTATAREWVGTRHKRILDAAAGVQSNLEHTTRQSQEMNRRAQEERERIAIIRYGVDVQGRGGRHNANP